MDRYDEKAPMKLMGITPHPDDVMYGAGGVFLTHRDDEKLIVSLTNIFHDPALEVAQDLGARIEFLGLEYNRIDRDGESIRERLTAMMLEFRPDYIFAPTLGDYKPDHYATGNLALAALIDSGIFGQHGTKLLRYPIPGSTTHFSPDLYVDISGVYPQKIEMGKKLIRGLNHLWEDEVVVWEVLSRAMTYGSDAGFNTGYAEAFECIQKVALPRLPPRNRSREHLQARHADVLKGFRQLARR